MLSLQAEKQRVKDSFTIPLLFVGILWLVKIVEMVMGISFASYGIYPRTVEGLVGIVTSPFIHGDLSHLFSNSVPIIVMGFIIFHSYQKISYELLGWLLLMSGFWTWLIGRSSFHIGASGIVYGLAFFIFFSGVFRKDIKSIALALLVCFLYGGIVWGMLPIQQGVSWEGHIAGAIAGTICAYYFRNVNRPQPHVWPEEEAEKHQNVTENPFWLPKSETPAQKQAAYKRDIPISGLDNIDDWEVKYHFLSKKKKEDNN